MMNESKLERAKRLWGELGEVSINDEGQIQEKFLHFRRGTLREVIWAWFETEFGVSVAKDLMEHGERYSFAQLKVLENPPDLVDAATEALSVLNTQALKCLLTVSQVNARTKLAVVLSLHAGEVYGGSLLDARLAKELLERRGR